jgi:hypothetical protein
MADETCAKCRYANQKLGELLGAILAKRVIDKARSGAFEPLTTWVEHLRRPDGAEHVRMQSQSNLSATYTANAIAALGDSRVTSDSMLFNNRSLQNQVVAAAFVRAVGGGKVLTQDRTQRWLQEIADELARSYWQWSG